MGLISDVVMWCWLLVDHWCQAMPIFGLQLAESLRALNIKCPIAFFAEKCPKLNNGPVAQSILAGLRPPTMRFDPHIMGSLKLGF
jgi:hypothetical protein